MKLLFAILVVFGCNIINIQKAGAVMWTLAGFEANNCGGIDFEFWVDYGIIDGVMYHSVITFSTCSEGEAGWKDGCQLIHVNDLKTLLGSLLAKGSVLGVRNSTLKYSMNH